MIWTQVAHTPAFRAYDSGAYRMIVDAVSATLSYRNTRLGNFGTLGRAHVAARHHLTQAAVSA